MYLKARRDEPQKRVRNVENSVERAESIGSQMGVVLEYLSGELGQVSRIIESAKTDRSLVSKLFWRRKRNGNAFPEKFMMDLHNCWRIWFLGRKL